MKDSNRNAQSMLVVSVILQENLNTSIICNRVQFHVLACILNRVVPLFSEHRHVKSVKLSLVMGIIAGMPLVSTVSIVQLGTWTK